LNHGDPSFNSTAAAECVAQQNTDAFWEIHEQLFQNQQDLWGADRDYYVNAAVGVGADQAQFESCFDSGSGLSHVTGLDNIRRDRGIFTQPVFDINGQTFFGSQSFDTFAGVIDSLLP
jgi:protein-disulfide isomerase